MTRDDERRSFPQADVVGAESCDGIGFHEIAARHLFKREQSLRLDRRVRGNEASPGCAGVLDLEKRVSQ